MCLHYFKEIASEKAISKYNNNNVEPSISHFINCHDQIKLLTSMTVLTHHYTYMLLILVKKGKSI